MDRAGAPEGNAEKAMSNADRSEMLALLATIEDQLDSLLDQLDGLLAACDRAELEAEAARWFAAEIDGPRTLH